MQEGAGKATINRIGEIRIAKVALETKLRAINHLIVEGHKDYQLLSYNCQHYVLEVLKELNITHDLKQDV